MSMLCVEHHAVAFRMSIFCLGNTAMFGLINQVLKQGNYVLSIFATPTLKTAVFRAAKKVKDPRQKDRMLYDVWKEREPSRLYTHEPDVRLPGAGSDFLPFEQELAIPTLGVTYARLEYKGKVYPDTIFPLYHTIYDGFRYVKMVDPDFKIHQAVASFLNELTRDLVDSPILPFDVRDYAKAVGIFIKTLFNKEKKIFETWNITSDAILSASKNFTEAAKSFHQMVETVDHHNPLAVRSVNDKLMTAEKAFQIYTGLPDRPEYKHVLLSPSSANYYKTTTFPGMADLLYHIGNNTERWQKVRQHLSVLTFCIQSAAKILQS